VDPIIPPEGVPVGEHVKFAGFENPPDERLNPRKNIFEKLAPFLTTTAGGCNPPMSSASFSFDI
jgi:aminoacyl tRNA synthase complex-interacting multifunctional protein 1